MVQFIYLTYQRSKAQATFVVYWLGIKKQIGQFIACCSQCQLFPPEIPELPQMKVAAEIFAIRCSFILRVDY